MGIIWCCGIINQSETCLKSVIINAIYYQQPEARCLLPTLNDANAARLQKSLLILLYNQLKNEESLL